jgi:alpha-galactosidase
VSGQAAVRGTGLILFPRAGALPSVWAGAVPAGGLPPDDAAALLAAVRPCSLLPEHGEGWFGRPGLSGHRLSEGAADRADDRADDAAGAPAAGRDWSPLFQPMRTGHDGRSARVEAADAAAGLELVTEIEAVPGGAIRARHTLTNSGRQPYVVASLDVVFPLPGRVGEVLDFTGRQTAERIPQRHRIGDGLWLREGRRGHTGHDSATVVVAGVPGFTFGHGEAYGLHVAWSGNTVHRVERVPSGPGATTIGGGELLLPGEVTLAEGKSYVTPWVYLAATAAGLDDISAQFHGYLRSLPAHPRSPRPVNLNVWEAVYFRHDFAKLAALADLAARLGVERYVLDDGWFKGRRDDTAGLGDWQADEAVWPGGLRQLADYVHARGMQFGLWIEPEMVNPDSELYRAHPDWILAASHRVPPLQRHQLVLDLTRPEVSAYLLEQISALLEPGQISYVKWDCNRDIIDAGSSAREGAPAAHQQALAVYALLDELRRRHPDVEWESCAAGGGRIDTPDDSAWMHGVVAADSSAALMSYVQLDEPRNDQPAALRMPGLDPRRRYRVTDVTPGVRRPRRTGAADARLPAVQVSGAALAEIGLAIPPQRTLTAVVLLIEAT